MKIFRSEEIASIDGYTIDNEPILSIDLMERAAGTLLAWLTARFDRSVPFTIFAGPGNNGGDGLALARMLDRERYMVTLCYINFASRVSDDWKLNHERLESTGVRYIDAHTIAALPPVEPGSVVVDAIFGTGLKRGVDGFAAEAIGYINSLDAIVVSVDMPSGLFGEDNGDTLGRAIVKADFTLSFQFPKLSFFMADCHHFTGRWEVMPIGLHQGYISGKPTDYHTSDRENIVKMLKQPGRFDHKGTNGHGLLVAGSCGKAGAAVLAGEAALRSGMGLLTIHLPKPFAAVVHSSLPEAMVQCDQSEILVSEVYDTDKYDAIAVGPGLGTKPNTVKGLKKLLEDYRGPMVIDADALNIIAANPGFFDLLMQGTILTPHPGEFDRLAGASSTSYERLVKQREMAMERELVIVLKGAYTSIALPTGQIWFNMSGNPGMATAGSGDVLTGMILGFLARGYLPPEAAQAAVYIHGLAGDLAMEQTGIESLIASDIIYNIGEAFINTRKDT